MICWFYLRDSVSEYHCALCIPKGTFVAFVFTLEANLIIKLYSSVREFYLRAVLRSVNGDV